MSISHFFLLLSSSTTVFTSSFCGVWSFLGWIPWCPNITFQTAGSRVIYPGPPRTWEPPYGKRDPYHEPISLGSHSNMGVGLGNSMGPAYYKGVPCPWGSLKIPLTHHQFKPPLRIPGLDPDQWKSEKTSMTQGCFWVLKIAISEWSGFLRPLILG